MIDFTQPIRGFSNELLLENQKQDDNNVPIKGTGTALTLGIVCARALAGAYRDDENLPGETKLKRGQLALKIFEATEPITLKSDEITLAKDLLAKLYSPLIIARAWPMLDPGEKTE